MESGSDKKLESKDAFIQLCYAVIRDYEKGRHPDSASLSEQGSPITGTFLRMLESVSGSVPMLKNALRLVSKDMHQVSRRPCPTCQMVSNALGEPFGCVAFSTRDKTT